VTGVCSTKNLELVQRIGADHVIDYTQQDFTAGTERYDLIVDTVGSHSLLEYRKALKPDGRYVGVGGPGGNWLGPLTAPIYSLLLSPFIHQSMRFMLAELNQTDLQLLADLMQSGKLAPVIDRTFDLEHVPEAIAYLEKGHARGKVVISLVAGNRP